MAVPIRVVRRNGNQLYVLMDDGTQYTAFKQAGQVWRVGERGGPGPRPPGPGPDPDTFTMVSNDGTLTFTISEQGMKYVRAVIESGKAAGLPRDGVVCGLMCVMVEAPPFLMYANNSVPASLDFPHDAVAGDEDSIGLFQQRPSMGWGTVAELMDARRSANQFYGGSNSTTPNPGLLDISPSWDQRASLGAAVQAVQVSAHPDRYENWTDACFDLYDAMEDSTPPAGNWRWPFIPNPSDEGGDMPPNGSGDQPLAEWGVRSGFSQPFHEGIDFGYGSALSGTPIPVANDGVVRFAAYAGGAGNRVSVDHSDGTSTNYFHLSSFNTSVGATVSAGDIIGNIGNTGGSFGAHLHFETHAAPYAEQISDRPATSESSYGGTSRNPRDFMTARGATGG